jgi:hypothetical protein
MPISISRDALVAHLAGEAVLLHAGTKEYFKLNETGQVIWQELEKGSDIDDIVVRLSSEYDVASDDARTAVNEIVDQLHAAGLIER